MLELKVSNRLEIIVDKNNTRLLFEYSEARNEYSLMLIYRRGLIRILCDRYKNLCDVNKIAKEYGVMFVK